MTKKKAREKDFRIVDKRKKGVHLFGKGYCKNGYEAAEKKKSKKGLLQN